MSTHELSPRIPDLRIARMWPCQASGIGPGARQCGGTPASQWRRRCPHGHVRECWLCPVHAKMIASGMASCADCAGRSVTAAAWLEPVDLLLLGHTGT
jgi:hypothetical protein